LPSNDIVTLLALGQPVPKLKFAVVDGAVHKAWLRRVGRCFRKLFQVSWAGDSNASLGLPDSASIRVLPVSAPRASEQKRGSPRHRRATFTRNLTITYVSNVSSTHSRFIQVEYNVNAKFPFVALRDQNGTFGIDVKIKKRFQ